MKADVQRVICQAIYVTRLVSANRYDRRRLAGSVPADKRLTDFPNKSYSDAWRRWIVSLGLRINIFDIQYDFGSYLFEKLAHWVYIGQHVCIACNQLSGTHLMREMVPI